jgi:hypothetical protein
MSPAFAWVRAFALTLAIEECVVLALTRRDSDSLPKRAGLVAFANLATHPAVWFIFPLALTNDGSRIVASEAWAIVLEAVFYAMTMKMTVSRAFGVSAVANAASFGVGVAVRALTGWV